MASTLSARDLRRALLVSRGSLAESREAIDAVNVFPVPDADTGTNMLMTFEAVARAAEDADGTDAAIAHAIADAALHGARGNSGVIVAEVLRAWAAAVAGGPADAKGVAAAFEKATADAYEAILQPAEGTILSVLKAAAGAAADAHHAVDRQFAAATRAAQEALRRTPEQMPLLAENGVVDAGGMGLVVVLEAIAGALGSPVEPFVLPEVTAESPAIVCARDVGDPTMRWEVQYVLEVADDRMPALQRLLGTIGDSVVVIGGEGRWRVHVHTDEPDRAVKLGEALGPVSDHEVVDFREQIAQRREEARAVGHEHVGVRGIPVAHRADRAGVVAVASGDGAARLFDELGAVVVRADDPAALGEAEIAAAVDGVEAPTVVLLPNHEDVFARAQRLLGSRDGRLTVLRTADQAQGLAVAVAYSDARAAEDSVRDMRGALDRVASGQVIVAPADAETPAGRVRAGQAIGFAEGDVVDTGDDPVAVALAVARRLLEAEREVLTILAGRDVTPEERDRLAERMAAVPAEVEVHDAGQLAHRYLLAAE